MMLTMVLWVPSLWTARSLCVSYYEPTRHLTNGHRFGAAAGELQKTGFYTFASLRFNCPR